MESGAIVEQFLVHCNILMSQGKQFFFFVIWSIQMFLLISQENFSFSIHFLINIQKEKAKKIGSKRTLWITLQTKGHVNVILYNQSIESIRYIHNSIQFNSSIKHQLNSFHS